MSHLDALLKLYSQELVNLDKPRDFKDFINKIFAGTRSGGKTITKEMLFAEVKKLLVQNTDNSFVIHGGILSPEQQKNLAKVISDLNSQQISETEAVAAINFQDRTIFKVISATPTIQDKLEEILGVDRNAVQTIRKDSAIEFPILSYICFSDLMKELKTKNIQPPLEVFSEIFFDALKKNNVFVLNQLFDDAIARETIINHLYIGEEIATAMTNMTDPEVIAVTIKFAESLVTKQLQHLFAPIKAGHYDKQVVEALVSNQIIGSSLVAYCDSSNPSFIKNFLKRAHVAFAPALIKSAAAKKLLEDEQLSFMQWIGHGHSAITIQVKIATTRFAKEASGFVNNLTQQNAYDLLARIHPVAFISLFNDYYKIAPLFYPSEYSDTKKVLATMPADSVIYLLNQNATIQYSFSHSAEQAVAIPEYFKNLLKIAGEAEFVLAELSLLEQFNAAKTTIRNSLTNTDRTTKRIYDVALLKFILHEQSGLASFMIESFYDMNVFRNETMTSYLFTFPELQHEHPYITSLQMLQPLPEQDSSTLSSVKTGNHLCVNIVDIAFDHEPAYSNGKPAIANVEKVCKTRALTFWENMKTVNPLIDGIAVIVFGACIYAVPQTVVRVAPQQAAAAYHTVAEALDYLSSQGLYKNAQALLKVADKAADYREIIAGQKGAVSALETHFGGFAAGYDAHDQHTQVVQQGKSTFLMFACTAFPAAIEALKAWVYTHSVSYDCVEKKLCPDTGFCTADQNAPCTPGEYVCDLIGQQPHAEL